MMKNKKADKKRNYNGFTLQELLIVIAIIGILASVVLVSLAGAKQKAKDSSTLQSMTTVAPLAYKCLVKAGKSINGRLTEPNTLNGRTSLCVTNGILDSEFPGWPDISSTDWGYIATKFRWCSTAYSGSAHPTGTSVGLYSNGTMGGDNATGKFCFMLCDNCSTNPKKWIWCTQDGCSKEGF